MTGFLAMGLVIAIAGLWLTRPLWRRVAPLTQPRRSANVAAYPTRVGAIYADLATATLAANSAQPLRPEAAPSLLRCAQAGPPVPSLHQALHRAIPDSMRV